MGLQKTIANLRSVAHGLYSSTMISQNEAERYKNLVTAIEGLYSGQIHMRETLIEIQEKLDNHIENQIFAEVMQDPEIQRLISLIAEKVNREFKPNQSA